MAVSEQSFASLLGLQELSDRHLYQLHNIVLAFSCYLYYLLDKVLASNMSKPKRCGSCVKKLMCSDTVVYDVR